MSATIDGLHHVTAICGAPQRNLDFHAGLLGLRFVKRTVNFDDPSAYHLYYGDGVGTPGSALTFFSWAHMAPGRRGVGETSLTRFAVPPGSLGFWGERLARAGVSLRGPETAFGEERLVLEDPDGLPLALVAADDPRTPRTTPEVGEGVAIRGFHGVTLTLSETAPTARLLEELLGYERQGSEGDATRYASPHAACARYVDLVRHPEGGPAGQGLGSVHHIAFSVRDRAAQAEVRERLVRAGARVTPQIDRTYFFSIYFRSPGGVLFEIATREPGFTVDEPAAELGQNLKLPPQHEHLRATLERTLPPLRL